MVSPNPFVNILAVVFLKFSDVKLINQSILDMNIHTNQKTAHD